MSKAFISCDLEGCSGIVNYQFSNPEGKFYQQAQAYMTGDLKAALQGLQSAGADEILVNDSHWNMTNIRIEDLPLGVNLISGGTKLDSMGEGLDDTFDAALFIGYHPFWGEPQGVIAHTYSGDVMEVRLNERTVGESGIVGSLAGYYGVPLIFVSGDTVLREEIRGLNPDIHFAVTKEGRTRLAARLYHPDDVHQQIEKEVGKAWRNRRSIKPLAVSSPVEFAVKFKETPMADICMRVPGTRRVDNLTVAYSHKDYLIAYRAFLALLYIANSVKTPPM
ncbi:MAG: M55 family metallopeptidase [Fidelibacterota bacterium]|nr:MAG: M55 family metallopeptidase [Candidatus Neomarinimicrobiota bacterium]